ncbi:D-aminoacylase [Candidatus Bathyarchaeota archaeon]|nr:D-aminoacylase [Candidatus Bathyarchaeota archaeon]
MEYDYVIKNGKILDGTGNPWFYADVGIDEGIIRKIGRIDEKPEAVIDAKGYIISPGFIDIHSHSDLPVVIDPLAQSKIRQGVTTEVVGQCGNSAAPMNEEVKEYRKKYNSSRVPKGFEYNWSTMKSYLDLLERYGVAVNIAPVVGHGTVRQNVMGYENREPTECELEDMRKLVREAMKDGAWGMSTGLIYPPSVYGKQPEITELTKVVAEYDGVYFSHIRGEGDTLMDAVTEACEIGKDSGAPVQIAHFKASGRASWGKTVDSLALVEKYRQIGVDVTFDQYPYIASSTNLTALLPHWSQEGGAARLLEYLNDPAMREKLKNDMRLRYDWSEILVTSAEKNPQYNGKNMEDVAAMMNKEPFTAYFDLLVMENTQVPSVMFGMSEEDVRRVMKSPYMMVGSDGSAISPTGIWENTVPHPRLYGTFPRVLGYYVREGVLSLEEAVRKMTSAPAQKLGLRDRGMLREGWVADITVFNPDTILDVATFTDPQRYAAGIHYVFVNGEMVVDKGEHTGALPGKALRKK